MYSIIHIAMLKLNPLALQAQRDHLIAQIPSWRTILRGSLMRYSIECRSRGCKCHQGKAFRHGPYWYLVVHRSGSRQKLYFIPPRKLHQVRQGKRAYDRLWKQLLKVSELNLLLLKAGDWRPNEHKRAGK